MHIPDEKSLSIAAAATMHKATAVCETDTQTRQVNLRQILNLPQIVMQANTGPSIQRHNVIFSLRLQALLVSLGSGSQRGEGLRPDACSLHSTESVCVCVLMCGIILVSTQKCKNARGLLCSLLPYLRKELQGQQQELESNIRNNPQVIQEGSDKSQVLPAGTKLDGQIALRRKSMAGFFHPNNASNTI